MTELKDPSVVVDVGAHQGAYAILLGNLVQKNTIIAVEPNPQRFKILEEYSANSTPTTGNILNIPALTCPNFLGSTTFGVLICICRNTNIS